MSATTFSLAAVTAENLVISCMDDKLIYEFGPFKLDPNEHLLMKAGEAINLSLQLFKHIGSLP